MSQLEQLKKYVIDKTFNKEFIYHKWFYEYHLKFVEQLAKELCELYPQADSNIVQIMVRIHDYDKISDIGHHNRDVEYAKLLQNFNFDDSTIQTSIQYIDLMEKKNEIDISQTPIEVQIISSADGASHFVGPFMRIHRKDKHHKEIHELMQDDIKKATKDRTRKITLPEVKKFIKPRYELFIEQAGKSPERFL